MDSSMAIKPRQVAVAIPVNKLASRDRDVRVCLVSSRKHSGKFVLPKGGVEKGETTRQAAVRELWEEAGILADEKSDGRTMSSSKEEDLTVADHKPHKLSKGQNSTESDFVPRAIYVAHEILVRSEEQQWPEQDERTRKWVSVTEAQSEIAWRKDIATLFDTWVSGLSQ